MDFSEIELPSNRKFGLFFVAIFALIGGYLFHKGFTGAAQLFGALCAAFLAISLLKAELLLPLNKLWMRLGLLLGMVISPIVLGVIFFGLFTPISLLMKLFGRDELRLRLVDSNTYWKKRDTDSVQEDAFKNQF